MLWRKGILSTIANESLIEYIRNIQQNYIELLPYGYSCIGGVTSPKYFEPIAIATADLNDIIVAMFQKSYPVDHNLQYLDLYGLDMRKTNHLGMVLITQYFDPDFDLTTKSATAKYVVHDITYALTRNLINNKISEIVVFTDQIYDFSSFLNYEKIKQITIVSRLSFKVALKHASDHYKNRTVIIGDIDEINLSLILFVFLILFLSMYNPTS